MHKKAIAILSVSSAVLLVGYLALVAMTIYFAALQTNMSSSLRAAETRVAALETEYYDAIARINAADAYAQGFVSPGRVEYVALDGREPVVSRANGGIQQ